MVTEIFEAQLKWFTRTLIKMRDDIDGYGAPIDFDLALITNCNGPDFDTANHDAEWHTAHMLNEIKNFLIKNKQVTFYEELSWSNAVNDHIEISGYTTKLLRFFLTEFLNESFSLFGEGQDNEGHTILTYFGRDTDISITGYQLVVFRCLKRSAKVVTFDELYEALIAYRRITGDTFASAKQKRSVLQSAISALEEKLKTVVRIRDNKRIIESDRGIGYSMTM